MLKSRRFKLIILRSLIALVLIIGIYKYFENPPIDFSVLKESKFEFNSEDIKFYKDHNIDIHSSNYGNLFSKVQFGDFIPLNLKHKCDYYFENMNLNDKDWRNDPLYGFSFNRNYFKKFPDFKEWLIKDLADNEKPALSDEEIEKEYNDSWKKIVEEEQVIHNYFTNLNIFNKCYVENKHSRKNLDEKNLIKKLMPYLSFKYPEIEDYNLNKLHLTDDLPNENFLMNLKSNLQGRGIVLTIKDSHVDDTIRLIKLLRFLGNQLPIQVVYFKNLSEESKKKLIDICRSDLVIGNPLPLQEIYFVNVSRAVQEKYLHKFEGFGNKILATLFNTFEEMILLDADTVILKPPHEFFDMAKYKQNGTIFFKDRKTVEFRTTNDLIFFKKMLPSKLDTIAFGIDQPTNYSLTNDFFQGLNHYMESGMVVINKKQHFFKPFIMAQLNFIYPVSTRIYGDKELFWLSWVIMGDESYSFNKHFAAAIGETTPNNERYKDIGKAKNFHSKELCSNHPAHINDEDDHTLLWFNSGFKFCGQNYKAEEEFASKKRYTNLQTIESFKTFFDSKLIIKQAIIPPSKSIRVDSTDGESDRSWLNMRQYCNGYTWCAYSSIGEDGDKDENLQGIIIEYSPDEINYFKQLGNVWMGNQLIKKSPPKKDKIKLSDHNLNEVGGASVKDWSYSVDTKNDV
ncbi:putative alpha-1,3-mannosyltransferase Mnn14p [[Candida] jaroonii]|uniref:Alpha-1,3-mannosyltransferase Mnn14p n=1 Tax=[Candida] jaroonii TaxID=467808 RepID=A0ACA9Y671_9ASCO|nr:putative alpha-1,3-mannosyltransferase Mnn14p [[Candida] jaroonii]